MLDVNGDGVLQVDEFIPFFRFLMLDFFPERILRSLNLSTGKILTLVFGLLLILGLIFVLISLVIAAFSTASSIGSTIHSGVNGICGVVAKQLSDNLIGF